MHIKTIRNSSSVMIHGVYIKSMWILFCGFTLFIILKLLGLFSLEILLYFDIVSNDFFKTIEFTIIKYSYSALVFIICVPTLILALRRSMLILNPCFSNSRISKTKLSFKSLIIFGIIWVMLLVLVTPIAVAFKLSYYFISQAGSDTKLFLFSIYLFILGIILLIPYFNLVLLNILVPFVLIKYQTKNIYQILRISFCSLKGNYIKIIRLLSIWFLPIISIIGIPFILPKLIAELSIFTDDITSNKQTLP